MLIDVPQNKAYALLTGGPTVFITSRSPEGRDNVMANAWNPLFNMDPTQVIVVFDLGHDSTKNIIASGEFGISVPGNALKKGLIGAGTMHARDITEDKFAYAHLEKLPARQINASLVGGALAHLECRIMDPELFARTGIALAEVVAAQVEEDYWDGASLICDNRPEQTLHSAGAYTYFPRGHVQPWSPR